MRFFKYHALGNDYLVLDPVDGTLPDASGIRRICHRNYGLGSDGILYGPLPSERGDFGLRILNPDGSEAEKSGNGLRIFCRYLYDNGKVSPGTPFTVDTPGGLVHCTVSAGGSPVTVEMGAVTFDASRIPVIDEPGEVLNRTLSIGNRIVTYSAASVGNPHCVVPVTRASAEEVQALGPLLEHHPRFPNRTNVQLLEVIDRNNIRIEIWERGAGYTLASGSSSSAAAAVARRLNLCDASITVHMPGGTLAIEIDDSYHITMTGPASKVGVYLLDPEVLS